MGAAGFTVGRARGRRRRKVRSGHGRLLYGTDSIRRKRKPSGNGRVLLSLACERFWLGARPVTWAATKGIYPGSRIHCYPDGGER
jgi:hypothetical protein